MSKDMKASKILSMTCCYNIYESDINIIFVENYITESSKRMKALTIRGTAPYSVSDARKSKIGE